jgi:hypothetical protein
MMNTEELHSQGYTVIPRFLNITNTAHLWELVSAYAEKHRMDPIFNFNASAPTDRRRRQIDMPVWMSALLRTCLMTAAPGRMATDCVILESLRGCQVQAAHTDYVPDAALLDTDDDTVPLLAVFALQSGTKLEVWPESHRLVRRARLTRHTPKVAHRTVELDAGDVIVFRGDLIHAGSAYTAHNLRIHVYLDHPTVPRPPNRTWVIQKHAEPLLRAAVLEEAT